ncbi:ArnT family glycosyltransferase [Sphingomonas hankyongi]|uniref:Glycosyltransferase RgtA/B/C/D-like domain-containing protein n=1 Tax=Sphingomonas hankyongi TaxID=2908209 RepID=A0ABT0S4L3_9SPHN|nr:hypothetical protein [Sphingomonas hankyongi]MCL6730795.1 hypothetical protein [Sphingomonas hankyongi]
MNAPTTFKPVETQAAITAPRIAIGLLLAILVYRFALFAASGIGAVGYPWELDYGEGIVWQQMRLIFTDQAYGPIDHFPAIVFHYPPLYHALTSVTASALGTDELGTGRAIALLSTLASAIASGFLVNQLLKERAPSMRRLCSCIAGLLVFTTVPVIHWAALMRVDMLAIALSLFGLLFTFKALERPQLIHVASLLFVAAVYTKQTSIAAPAAAFAVLLAARPRLAFKGVAGCALLGLAVLATLSWATDGGFFRHIFLYNVNRTDLSRLSAIVYAGTLHLFFIAVAAFVLARRTIELWRRYRGTQHRLADSNSDTRFLIALAYALTTTAMLVLVAKSGSSINYFLEWFFAMSLFAAMGPAEFSHRAKSQLQSAAAIGIPAALALHAWFVPLPRSGYDANSERGQALAALSREIAAADKPVISDDMVLLLRSGKPVLWEPAIFAELASTGDWDERPFVRRIRNREFAFFVTWGQRGFDRFDERYNPAVADAIDAAYPIKQRAAGLIVHRTAAR